MAKDLRELFKNEREDGKDSSRLKSGHEARFAKRLEHTMPKGKTHGFRWFRIAATVTILVGVACYFLLKRSHAPLKKTPAVVEHEKHTKKGTMDTLSLGKLSPDLKKVEDYYLASIHLGLSKIELSEGNKGLVNSFMEQLSGLNTEYENLNRELNELGPNDQTINALIKNLELRLQLLQKLKRKLNTINTSKNEQIRNNAI